MCLCAGNAAQLSGLGTLALMKQYWVDLESILRVYVQRPRLQSFWCPRVARVGWVDVQLCGRLSPKHPSRNESSK